MSLSTEENSEFRRITAVLKQIDRESFLKDLKKNDLTVRVKRLYKKTVNKPIRKTIKKYMDDKRFG
jgi:hypothetical protein